MTKKHISTYRIILRFLHEMNNNLTSEFLQKVIFENFVIYEGLHGQRRNPSHPTITRVGCHTRPRFRVVPCGLLQYSFRRGAEVHYRQAATSVERSHARCQ